MNPRLPSEQPREGARDYESECRHRLLSGLVLDDGRTWSEAATDWQLEDARAVIGGDPPYNFLTRARGGSKTTDLAGIALCFLLTMPPRSRLIWCAADLDQGSLAIDSISGFVSRTPDLAGEVEIKAKSVVATATESTLEVLPADAAGAFGLRPDFVAVDEIAQWGETSGPQPRNPRPSSRRRALPARPSRRA